MKLRISPIFTIFKPSDMAGRNAVLACNNMADPAINPYFIYGFFCQFAARVIYAIIIAPSLFIAIYVVVNLKTKKQMIGVDARGIVALVKDAHFWRNLSLENSPCYAVRRFNFAVFVSHISIAIGINSSLPQPTAAICGNLNKPIKSFLKWCDLLVVINACRHKTCLLGEYLHYYMLEGVFCQ